MQFAEKIHVTKPENIYAYNKDTTAQNALYFNRHGSDYNDKSGIKYEEPERKVFVNKFDSFVKNTISNKAKTVINDLSPKNKHSAKRTKLVQDMINVNTDFRKLNKFKNSLFEFGNQNKKLKDNCLLKKEDFMLVLNSDEFDNCLA